MEEELNKQEAELEMEGGYGIHTPEVLQALKKTNETTLNLSNLPIEILTKNVADLTAKEFTSIRRQGFGGSDSSMLLGVNPYQDERELINSKTLPFLPDSAEKQMQLQKEAQVGQLSSVRKGNDLEPLVIKKASEAFGVKIIKPTDMYRFKEYPYLSMNFDGVGVFPKTHNFAFVSNHHGYAPVEIKIATVKGQHNYQPPKAVYSETRIFQGLEPWAEAMPPLSEEQMRNWDIARKADYYGIPKYYYTQVQQEMMAVDANGAFLAVLFETSWEMHIFFIPKDIYVWNALKIRGYEVWQKVENIIEYYTKEPTETQEALDTEIETVSEDE